MATPLTTCGSCHKIIYREAGQGGCACPDGPYYRLMAESPALPTKVASGRIRTASQVPQARKGTPDLEPGLFLSPAGAQEMRVAQALRSGALRPTSLPGVDRGRPQQVDTASFDFDLDGEGAPAQRGFEVEFDMGDVEIPRGPVGGDRARFRVDRPPVREPFVPRTLRNDYEVVRTTAEIRELARTTIRTETGPQPASARPPRPPITPLSAKTAYDHLNASQGSSDDDPFS